MWYGRRRRRGEEEKGEKLFIRKLRGKGGGGGVVAKRTRIYSLRVFLVDWTGLGEKEGRGRRFL